MIGHRRQFRFQARGFTLVEVLVAMALMGIVLPVAMNGISIAMKSASYARHAAEAAALGQTKLNEIVALISTQQTNPEGTSGDFGPQWPAYTWQYEEVYDADLSIDQLTLIVTWSERGLERTLRLTTMVADTGPAEDAAAAATGA